MFSNDLISTFQTLKTPFYYYDMNLLRQTLGEVKKHGIDKGYHVHYAIKANFNFEILDEIRKAGLGIDCVSGKEVERALQAGFSPEQIAFAGVGKNRRRNDYRSQKRDLFVQLRIPSGT
jgi:diaminopimelate decarboxylase